MSPSPAGTSAPSRERILRESARLLREGGADAVTTRAIEAAAGVQAPTIYRLFGDKQGVLEAVADRELSAWVEAKAQTARADRTRDPIDVLRDGWQSAVQFGLDNPALFALMHTRSGLARPWAAVEQGSQILHERVRRVAAAGRLAVSEERAVDLLRASVIGAVLLVTSKPHDGQQAAMLDDLLAGLLSTVVTGATDARPESAAGQASALRATLADRPTPLTPGESALLDELLLRIADG